MTSSASASSRRIDRATRYRRVLYRRIRISKSAVSPSRIRRTSSSSDMPSLSYRVAQRQKVPNPTAVTFRPLRTLYGWRTEMAFDRHLNTTWLVLRTAIGLMALLAGLDKFFNLLTNWPMYLSPLAERLSPLPGPALMRVFGVVEIVVGLAILTKWTR